MVSKDVENKIGEINSDATGTPLMEFTMIQDGSYPLSCALDVCSVINKLE